jgi:hypothetical protein
VSITAANPQTSNIRAMQLGEILDGSFSIFRRHFGLFMRLSILLVWLPTALMVYLQLRFGSTPFAMMNVIEEHTLATIFVALAIVVVWTACSLMLKAGTIRIISDSYLGQEPDLASALRFAAQKIIPLLLVALSKGLLLVLIYAFGIGAVVAIVLLGKVLGSAIAVLMAVTASVALVWFVIYVACGYGVTTPIVVLEDLDSSFDAFGRSWDLTRGSKRKIFGTIVVTWLLSQMLPQMVVGGISGAFSAASPETQPIFVVLASLLGIVLAPILPCALTLLYYDLRVRREAFDLQVLSDQLGQPTTGVTGAPGATR